MATITDSYLVGQDYELSTTTQLGFTHPGYTFKEWNCSEGDTHEEGAVVKFSTKQTQITATWTPIEYSIAYELSGGTNNPGNPSKYTIESDDIVFLDPTKSGSTFDKWVNEDGETVTGIVSGSMGDVNVIAQWLSQPGTKFTLSDDTVVEMSIDETGTSIGVASGYITKTLKSPYKERFGTESTSILKSVELSPEITSIASAGFASCPELTGISGENVTMLTGNYDLAYDNKLQNVYLPALKQADGASFLSDSALTSVTLNGDNLVLRTDAFSSCKALSSIQLTSTSRLAKAVFNNCVELTSVSFANLLSVGYNAFDGCAKLSLIDMSLRTDTSMPFVEGWTSTTTCSWRNGITIKLPANVKEAWEAKVADQSSLTVSEQFWVSGIESGKFILEEAT